MEVKRAGHATRQWIRHYPEPTRTGKESLVGRPEIPLPHTTDNLTLRYIYTRLAANVTKAYRYYYYRMVNVLAGQVVKDGACVWASGRQLGWME